QAIRELRPDVERANISRRSGQRITQGPLRQRVLFETYGLGKSQLDTLARERAMIPRHGRNRIELCYDPAVGGARWHRIGKNGKFRWYGEGFSNVGYAIPIAVLQGDDVVELRIQ